MSASQKIGIAFRSYGSANRFIKKHKLWHYVYIPGILNIVLFYFSFNWFIMWCIISLVSFGRVLFPTATLLESINEVKRMLAGCENTVQGLNLSVHRMLRSSISEYAWQAVSTSLAFCNEVRTPCARGPQCPFGAVSFNFFSLKYPCMLAILKLSQPQTLTA